MVSSCKFNYKVPGRKAKEEAKGPSATSYIKCGIPFQQTSFISLGEANSDMPFELERKASEEKKSNNIQTE